MPIIDNILIESGTGTKIVASETTSGSSANTATVAMDTVASHTHVISDVINLQSELDNKASLTHTHTTSDITDFDVKVANKIAATLQLSGKADAIHTHQATDIIGLHSVATTGNYNSLINKPVLGSVSTLNIAISGDANASQVVLGNDSRLTNARAALPHDHDLTIGDGSSPRIITKTSNTLNFVAGANITLGFDDATKKITISSAGGSSVDKLTTARAIRFVGGITGSGFFDGSSDLTINTTLTGAHTHNISDIVGLQATIDGKISTSYFSSFGDTLVKAVDQAAGRVLFGLGSIATRSDTEFAPSSHVGSGGLSHSVASSTNHGFMSISDKTKLDSISANATANSTDAILKDRANHTGVQAISTITGLQTAIDSKSDVVHSHSVATTTAPGFLSVTDKAKLDSIASNASSNSPDSFLKDRANHTGTQAVSTITGLATVAVTGNYNDLSNVPSYGTASSKNVATIGDAQATQVVMGNDSRLTDSRNPLAHNHTLSIGDGSSSRISVSTAERLDIVPGANVSVVYDDVLNKITIATTGVIAGSVDTAIRLATARTIALTGSVSGSTTFDGSSNVSISAVVADNSHNHIIDNISGLQAALNTKANTVHTHNTATASSDGMMSISDKAKLDGIAANATANSSDVVLKDRANHTGVQAISTITGLQTALDGKAALSHTHVIPVATTTADGLLSAADKAKLDTVSSGAGGGSTIASITGLQAALDTKASTAVVTSSTNGLMIAADKVKLDTLDSTVLKDRANHTGVQAISTVTGLQTALDSKAALTHTHVIPVATTTADGLLSAADKAKIDIMSSGGSVTSISNITGLQAALDSKASTAVVTTTTNGLMIAADKAKLDGISANATANSTDAILKDRANHTGVQAISTITGLQTAIDGKAALSHVHAVATTTTDGFLSAADKTKLDSISSGAGSTIASITGLQAALDAKASNAVVTTTTNGLMIAADKVKLDGLNSATLLDRANQTGVQAISTVTGLQTALDAKAALTHTHTLSIGDGTTAKVSVGTNERLDIAAGNNITIAYDDTLNKVTINSSATVTSVATADKWSTPRTISLTGAVTGSASIDGSANISIATVGATLTKFFNQTTEPTGVIDGDRWYSDATGVVLTRIGSVWAEL